MVSLTTLGSGRVFLTVVTFLNIFVWNEKNLSILKDLNEKGKK